jgi:hypothetical protein
VVGKHTCLKVFANQQLGEVTGGNNWAQENVFDFTASASVPEPQILQIAVRNPRKEKSLVYVSLQNVPFGYIVQFPHQWLMLDALAERTLEMVVIPRLDYSFYENADKYSDKQEYRTKRRADIRIVGFVPREYTSEMTDGRLVGSRMFHIGGILTRVTPKLHSNIELSEDKEYKPEYPFLGVVGRIIPAQANEKASVFLTSPDSRQWVLEVTTDSQGMFRAVFDLTTKPTLDTLKWQSNTRPIPVKPADEIKPTPGIYKAQAFLVNSPNAAEAESNVVSIQKNF